MTGRLKDGCLNDANRQGVGLQPPLFKPALLASDYLQDNFCPGIAGLSQVLMPHPSVTPFVRNLRRSPRLEAPLPLTGRIPDLEIEGRIRDVGFGGFTLDVPRELIIGIEQVVEFVCDDTLTITLRARPVYCRATNESGDQAPFLAGFAFSERGERARELVGVLISRVVRALSSEWVASISQQA
jgi:PilZ domain